MTRSEMARRLGVSERGFYRRLNAGDPAAQELARQEILKDQQKWARLVLLMVECNWATSELRKVAPKLTEATSECRRQIGDWMLRD